MQIITRNQWLSITLLAVLGASLGGCGFSMSQAKEKLEAGGMTGVELTPSQGGGFDFTGVKNGQKCSGTIQGESSPASESDTVDMTCGAE